MMTLRKPNSTISGSMASGLNRVPSTTGRASTINNRTLNTGKPNTSSFARPEPPRSLTRGGLLKDRTNTKSTIGGGVGGVAGTKRAGVGGSDLKDRMEDMDARLALLENSRKPTNNAVEIKEVPVQNSEELNKLKDEKTNLENQLKTLHEEMNDLKKKQENDVEDFKKKSEAEVRDYKRKIGDLEFNVETLERKLKSVSSELDDKVNEVSGLKSTVSSLTSASVGMEAKLKCVDGELSDAKSTINTLTQLSEDQKKTIAEYEEEIRMHEEKARNHETERRRLHNLIQELKGNIRVFCRVRPLLGDELKNGGAIKHIDIKSDTKSLELIKPGQDNSPSNEAGLKSKFNQNHEFEFDKVFGPNSTQAHIFDEICQLVQSAIDGYNVCVFAYGQTGSGKTYTMEGGPDDENSETEGMIPKTIRQIFDETDRLKSKGWSYTLQASFLEIYNEEIRDLLATEKNLKYEIKMNSGDKKNEVYVNNAKTEVVTSQVQINNLLKRARKNRAVAATNCNERSSRSHSVFILKITGTNSITTEACTGCLNLVDLAGSERLKDSGSEGARLKETVNINKSLANLSTVIMALAQKDNFVPYRNSKLTYLLQNSLGGNSKTLMFVNINPKEEYFNETVNSLRFATKVNQCQIGTATKKVK